MKTITIDRWYLGTELVENGKFYIENGSLWAPGDGTRVIYRHPIIAATERITSRVVRVDTTLDGTVVIETLSGSRYKLGESVSGHTAGALATLRERVAATEATEGDTILPGSDTDDTDDTDDDTDTGPDGTSVARIVFDPASETYTVSEIQGSPDGLPYRVETVIWGGNSLEEARAIAARISDEEPVLVTADEE